MGHNALQFLSFYCLYTPHFTSTSHTRPSYQRRYCFVTQTAVGIHHHFTPELRLVRCSRHQQGRRQSQQGLELAWVKVLAFDRINQY